jgi:metal-responsive CopG/Arc/MetJ family transcriptional regulator
MTSREMTPQDDRQESRRAHIVVPEALLDEIDRMVGMRGRSSFFVEAATEKLRRARLLESARSVAGSLKDLKGPWASEDETDAYVRGLREDSELRMARLRTR